MAKPSIWTEEAELAFASRWKNLSTRDKLRRVERMSTDEAESLLYMWAAQRRPDQVPPPGEWSVWVIQAGRGSGKTRTGGEFVRSQVKSGCSRIALVAETAADARDVMVEGESGILKSCWRNDRDYQGNFLGRPHYEPSKRRLTWANGAIATTYSAEDPEQLRGPQHDAGWADEVAKWRYADTWDQLSFGMRLGIDPRVCATTTPRPNLLMRRIIKGEGTIVTRGSTYANRANLAESFFRTIIRRFEGTRLGRQELDGDLIDDIAGALWSRLILENGRVKAFDPRQASRIVVAVDPAASSGEDADETGIAVAARDHRDQGYVLESTGMRDTPDQWGRAAVLAYDRNRADCMIGEVNNGGEMVGHVVKSAAEALHREGLRESPEINFRAVHATRGKVLRAEPISALYEQGRCHHVGMFAELEDQMCNFTSDFDRKKDGSPDRLDAAVYALTDLMLDLISVPIIGAVEMGQTNPWVIV